MQAAALAAADADDEMDGDADEDEEDAAPAKPARPAGPILAPGTVRASSRRGKETVRATHGLAWWEPDAGKLAFALFDHAPSAGMLAAARAGEWGQEAPVMTFEVRFEEGRSIEDVYYCYVSVSYPEAGPFSVNTSAEGCGIGSLAGDIRAGGEAEITLQGAHEGFGMDWDIALRLPIAK